MDFVDSAGTRYQFTESAEAPEPPKKAPVWPWVVGGLAVAGGLVWMASQTSRKPNPVTPEIEALIAEARDPKTPFGHLWELAEHPDVEVRRALLDNPNVCPSDDQGQLKIRLLEDLAQEFPEEVAAHPLFVLHALIEPNDEFEEVVRKVVERTADVGLIEQVFRTWKSSSGNVRQAVASNPKAPEDLLRYMGNQKTESDWRVRQGVALNPSTPEDLLRTLGNPKTDSQWQVRQAVAQNPNTPVDVLRTLGNQQTEYHRWVRWAVAENPNTPKDLLRTLGNPRTESNEDVRKAAAMNPSTPVDTLRSLGNEATESEWKVREAVVWNPNTPVDVLRTLANPTTESNRWVRESTQKALAARGLV